MNRLFGKGKKKVEEAPPANPREPFDLNKHTQKIDTKTDEMERRMRDLEAEIRTYYAKLKTTALTSEKTFIKTRLKNLLMKRKNLEGMLNRYSNQKMMFDKIQYNKETVEDTIDMARYMKDANDAQKKAMEQIDFDKFQDHIEDMQDLAYENDRIAEMMNDNFDVDVDEDLDAELENLENELAVEEMMKVKNKSTVNPQTLIK